MSVPSSADHAIRFSVQGDGSTNVELVLHEQVVSFLTIISLTIAVGRARVRVDGIGGVETLEQHRKQGYSRQVLEASIAHMRRARAALSMLYGIPDFYPKFGYATAGPEYAIQLRSLSLLAPLPADWTQRRCRPEDAPAIHGLYEQATARAVGAVQRPAKGDVWSRLDTTLSHTDASEDDECRVVVSPAGAVEGYAWRGTHFWPVRSDFGHRFPQSLVIGEVIAGSALAADALLATCCIWGAGATTSKAEPVKDVVLSFPPQGPLYAASLRQATRWIISSWPAENFMARTLNVYRLLAALAPELSVRRQALPSALSATLRLETDIGSATLHVTDTAVTVAAGESLAAGASVLRLPQTDLTRLALGALPPGDVLERLESPPDDRTRALIEALFPQQRPYMHLADRV
ncbi:MAG TPA: GNAT family N-acetyltransferase [Chloroflexota bacterium]|nr:GNAT family N-acetyltransferase [Chloroflexota bacterium]